MSEWQPIESAPKDQWNGILVWVPDFHSSWMVYWHKDEWAITGTDKLLGQEPTHWMPLPAPPPETR